MSNLKGKDYKQFEDIKHIDDNIEFWYARELSKCRGMKNGLILQK